MSRLPYHTVPQEVDTALRVRKEWLGTNAPAPSTLVFAPELPVHGPTVVMDTINLAMDASLGRQAVITNRIAPAMHVGAMGFAPYVYAVRGGGFVFTAGRAAATAQGLVEEIHLVEMKNLAGLDEVWRKFFPTNPPARVVVPLRLPSACTVEIELIAVDSEGPYRRETITTPDAPVHLGHEPQAVKAGPYLFMSGQLATDYEHGVPPEAKPDPNFPFHSSSIKRQVEYIYKNVEAICEAAGTSPQNLVKRRVAHLDLADMPEAEEVWSGQLGERLPPTTFLRVNDPLTVPGCAVQYDLIAAIPD